MIYTLCCCCCELCVLRNGGKEDSAIQRSSLTCYRLRQWYILSIATTAYPSKYEKSSSAHSTPSGVWDWDWDMTLRLYWRLRERERATRAAEIRRDAKANKLFLVSCNFREISLIFPPKKKRLLALIYILGYIKKRFGFISRMNERDENSPTTKCLKKKFLIDWFVQLRLL